ncbi:Similar to Uncharacterized protein YFR016C; acc. no. P43597 [Pyronema omphalodes CBS 100304]|uniref:Similar to Uncharacterized protein YFR016C acc. no. P43597 n=1 Tax=Pyronema omphalodes (strain CBS 100304) TaxID=1076935 RepID=U4LC04_PYROM|nr:Similar to Uncharacterized protein YFR016C; acc. no. P43597 [Pyronema omphalodes CBS 100304]
MSRQVAKPEEPHHAPGEAPATFDPVAFDRDESDTIFLLTSLSAGSSTIITATTRLEHILKSNKVPFKSVDLATDDKAKRLWHWKGNGRRLPAIAKEGEVIGNYEECEDWNEHGELRIMLGLSKKKKKSGLDLDGSSRLPNPSRTAKPNIPEPKPERSTDPVNGIPTAFLQAKIASAAAKMGRDRLSSVEKPKKSSSSSGKKKEKDEDKEKKKKKDETPEEREARKKEKEEKKKKERENETPEERGEEEGGEGGEEKEEGGEGEEGGQGQEGE